jgi:Cu+-exporting ATPase
MERDPVCGMEVDPELAARAEHRGKTYYFCSEGCLATFQEAPERYAARDGAEGGRLTTD